MNNYPKNHRKNIIVKELENEILIYDIETKKAFCLNETSALVWKFCDGKTTPSEVCKMMEKELGKEVDNAIVWLTLDGLKKNGLLSDKTATRTRYRGLTRRQVLRNIGVLSAISLPIVTSLVAPRASFAQSCVGAGTIPSGQILTGSDCPFPGPPCSCSGFNSSCCSGSASVDSCTSDPGVAPGLPAGMQRCFCMCD